MSSKILSGISSIITQVLRTPYAKITRASTKRRKFASTRMLLLLSMLASSSTAVAQETKGVAESELVSFIQNKRKEINLKKEDLQEELKRAKVGKVDKRSTEEVLREKTSRGFRYQFKSKESKSETASNIESEIKALENDLNLLPFLPFEPYLAVGNVGRLPPKGESDEDGFINSYTVVQVLDENSSLVKWHEEKYVPAAIPKADGFGGLRPASSEERDMVIWLISPTKGWTNDRRIDIGGTYLVKSTKTYQSTVGTNTVFVLEKFDTSEYLAKAKPAVAK